MYLRIIQFVKQTIIINNYYYNRDTRGGGVEG